MSKMETNYKIKPEIREFIIKEAKEHPELSCRKLSGLILEHFKLTISKSSISSILKGEGLSQSIGRRSLAKKAASQESASPKAQVLSPTLPMLTAQEVSFLVSNLDKEAASHSLGKQPPEPGVNLPLAQAASQSGPPSLSWLKEIEEGRYLPYMGCWFLKAAELSLGGIQALSQALCSGVKNIEISDIIAKNETLLYFPLFGLEDLKNLDSDLQTALGIITEKRYSAEDIQSYLDYIDYLGKFKPDNLGIPAQLNLNQREVLGLKFILGDDGFFFLDAASHSIWSTGRIPKYFSAPLYKTRDILNRSFSGDSQPLVLQAPPGFEAPTAAFLNFILSFQAEDPKKSIRQIELYSKNNELIEALEPKPKNKRYFILGLWPWQYVNRDPECSNSLSNSSGSRSQASQNSNIRERNHLFEINGVGPLFLRAVVLKKDSREILTIITNIEEKSLPNDKVIELYLERWPNLELGYRDFLNKIGHSAAYFEIKPETRFAPELIKNGHLGLSQFLTSWRRELNNYCQGHFFPLSYQALDPALLQERFYNLSGKLRLELNSLKVIFGLPPGYAYTKDLLYGCQRVNEADIRLREGRRLRFEIE